MRRIILGFCLSLVAAAGAARAAEPVSAELIRLHDDLHLTANQETAWHDYVTAVGPDPQAIARHRAAQALMPQVPTPRRIALVEATMAQDNIDFHRQAAAINAFYATLTPTQQRVFDRDTVPTQNQQSLDPGDS
jgi:hypothetical protein